MPVLHNFTEDYEDERTSTTEILVLVIYPLHGPRRKHIFHYCTSLFAGETCTQSCSLATTVVL
jgi:hypothetical protein